MAEWKHIAHGETDYFRKKPSNDGSWEFMLIIALIVLAIAALYYITWPWWYPLKELVILMNNVEAKHGTFEVVVIVLSCLVLLAIATLIIVSILKGLDVPKFLACVIASISYCWLVYGIASLAIALFLQ